jgi:ketosteroid isomerase-like protein
MGEEAMAEQRNQVEVQAQRLGDAWAAAERQGDANGLERMLAADFVGVGPRGFLLSKAQWLARYQSGDFINESFTWQDVTARAYGSTTVLVGRQTSQGTYQGHPVQGDFRTTLVFVHQDGGPRLVSLHVSPIAEG